MVNFVFVVAFALIFGLLSALWVVSLETLKLVASISVVLTKLVGGLAWKVASSTYDATLTHPKYMVPVLLLSGISVGGATYLNGIDATQSQLRSVVSVPVELGRTLFSNVHFQQFGGFTESKLVPLLHVFDDD